MSQMINDDKSSISLAVGDNSGMVMMKSASNTFKILFRKLADSEEQYAASFENSLWNWTTPAPSTIEGFEDAPQKGEASERLAFRYSIQLASVQQRMKMKALAIENHFSRFIDF
jgi:hypothetical protein